MRESGGSVSLRRQAGGALPADLPTFAEGLTVARLMDAARLASKERRRVHLEEIM